MKNLNIYIIVLVVFGGMVACEEELPSLGKLLDAEDLEFTITQNPSDPNMVLLESLTPEVIPLWTTPLGRSTRVKDTVRLAFAGTYKFVYSVQGAAGFVSADTVTLEIATNNLSYVDDPLWTNLTGGVGESKTWLLDIDANALSKYWGSPMYFSGDVWRWGNTCSVEDARCWIWEPVYAGNEWIAAPNDYGTMTFSLEGNPAITVDHMNTPGRGLETGTYFLDVDAKILKITDAAPLLNDWADANIPDWSTGYLISLTEDAMQIGYKDGGKEEFIIFNYISQEYSDNWVPEETADPEPPYDGDANFDLTTNVSTTKTWAVSLDYPYNWLDLAGAPLNEVATYGSDPAGFTFTTWTPPYDEGIFSGISAEFTKVGDADGTYVIETQSGTVEGTYTIDASNNIDFGQPVEFFAGLGGWLTFGTTAENTLRVIDTDLDPFGNVTGIWLGQRAPDKPEYLSLHLEVAGGGGEVDPLDAWKDALVGKTFIPDVNWFVDWVGTPPAFTGGWTSASTFGDDITSNTWIWDQSSRDIAETASLMFFMDGNQLKVTVSQTLITEHEDGGGGWITDDTNVSYSVTGNVNIDTDTEILTIDVPLVDYAGTPARWLEENGTGGIGEWFFVSHGGSTLGNIDAMGLWLGYSTPGNETETTIFHYLVQ